MTRQVRLEKGAYQIFEVLYFCRNPFRCRMSVIMAYHAWPQDNISIECGVCDICQNYNGKRREMNIYEDIEHMLRVIQVLTAQDNDQIIPDDIVDVFCQARNAKIHAKRYNELPIYHAFKPKFLKTKELALFALTDLIVRKLVQHDIILRKITPTTTTMACSVYIIGIASNALEEAKNQNWMYRLKN